MILSSIQKYILQEQPLLNKYQAKLLLLGNQSQNGLISVCGESASSSQHLVCRKALELLSILLSYEKYKFANVFRLNFSSIKTKHFRELQLDLHISLKDKDNCSYLCQKNALQIIQAYIEKNSDYPIDTLIENEEAYKFYQKWNR